jgi:cobalt-zinc-cadmium efflux system outer membrane protein
LFFDGHEAQVVKRTLTAGLTWIAPLAALIGMAGCASSRNDLAAIQNQSAPAEAAMLPSGIVHEAPAKPAAADIALTGAQEEQGSDTESPRRRGNGLPNAAGRPSLERRVEIPKELPGAEVPRLQIPDKIENDQAYEEAIRKLFPSLSDPPPMILAEPEVPVHRMTLFELEQTALANSPLVAQAQADVTSAVGDAIQAGTAPNPLVGYEADTVGSAGTRNYQGVFATQLIKTAGKLQLQQAVRNVDVMNAQLMLRQTRLDVLTQVRRQYFTLLVARESIKINEAIVRFTHELYRIHVEQVSQELAAPYEPSWLRNLAVVARGALVAARNSYVVAWKQLVAILNVPQLPPADLVDNPEIAVPRLDYDATVSHILTAHTEARISRNMPIRARLDLRLQEITPVPDVSVYATFQRDFTTPGLGRTTYNTQIGMPLPILDRNKGNILSARGALRRATQEVTRVENDLRSRLAEAFGRFETNRFLVGTQRNQILPDSVRAYRGTYERHIQSQDEVGFTDVIVAQQNLLSSVAAYLTSLTGQWNAFVDIADLLQVDSLHELHLQLLDQVNPPEPGEGRLEQPGDVSTVLSEMLSGNKKQ